MAIKKQIREELKIQVGREITTARWYKQNRVTSWHKNENLLYESERFKKEYDTRSQVALNKMNGYLHTIMSKIDNPLVFKYAHRNPADIKKVKKINALRELDAERDNWDFKDLLGKEQGIFYGRAIYNYFADSEDGYSPHLSNIDVYDFLIDPNAGGLDIEKARYLGHYNTLYDRTELEAGVRSGKFLREETNSLLEAGSTADVNNQEDVNKDNNRFMKYRSFLNEQNQTNQDMFKFWSWFTTYKGERYYVLYAEQGDTIIRCEKLKDLAPSGKYPYWSWACFPQLTEFWSQSYADLARDIFMAQSMTINQMMDNADRINNPQRIIDTSTLVDEQELKFKKRGFIRFRGADARAVMQTVEVPTLDAPLSVYDTLETIVQLQTGVTGAVQGIAEEDKVGIYEGNQAATSDRFNLLNKSYSNGYKKFAQLYLEGLEQHLTKKVAIKLLGPDGVEADEITKDDLKTIGDIDMLVEATNTETNNNLEQKKNKIAFLSKYLGVQFVNPKAVFEIEAEINGFNKDDTKRLLDLENITDTDVVSEAYRDIEDLITGKEVKPNDIADVTYANILYDYMRDKKENLKSKQFFALADYFESILPIVTRNQVLKVQTILAERGQLGDMGGVPQVEPNINMQPQVNGVGLPPGESATSYGNG